MPQVFAQDSESTRRSARFRVLKGLPSQHLTLRVGSMNCQCWLEAWPDMNVILLVAGLALGAALGSVIGFLYARIRQAGVTADLAAQARAADERARAAQDQAALVDGYLAERFQALSAQALDASQ